MAKSAIVDQMWEQGVLQEANGTMSLVTDQ